MLMEYLLDVCMKSPENGFGINNLRWNLTMRTRISFMTWMNTWLTRYPSITWEHIERVCTYF